MRFVGRPSLAVDHPEYLYANDSRNDAAAGALWECCSRRLHVWREANYPGEDLSLLNAYRKRYDIYPSDLAITAEQVAESRVFVAIKMERLGFEGELGRCC